MNPHIEKALAYLLRINYAGYFEEMDKVGIPEEFQYPYATNKGMFIAGQKPWDFPQTLRTLAMQIEQVLSKTKPTPEPEIPILPVPDQSKTLYIIFADLKGYGANAGNNDLLAKVTTFFFSLKDKYFADGKEHFFKPLGDGILATGHSLTDMAQKALAMRNDIKNHTWKQAGFPDNLNVRMALHVGEAIEHYNPNGTIRDVSGTAVIQAARLEPYTMVGEVFCSQTYADLLAQDKTHNLATINIGKYNLGKAHDTFELDIAVLFAESDKETYEEYKAEKCKKHLEEKTKSPAVEQSAVAKGYFDASNAEQATANVSQNAPKQSLESFRQELLAILAEKAHLGIPDILEKIDKTLAYEQYDRTLWVSINSYNNPMTLIVMSATLVVSTQGLINSIH
ncbi:MAG: hypothetical protein EAZ95_14680 [Bacteroidetes bacterium]|nr:MAG: hypothetical protein EAZ95_14680 [Bacteroidota bacterium]